MTEKILEDRDFLLWVMLYQARDAILKARNKELYKYDLSFMKAGLLLAVQASGGKPSGTDISKWMFREPHTISGLVGRLIRNGLVTRAKVPGKKNMMEISLTEKGKEAYEQSLKMESIHEILSCLTEDERKQLYATLQKLRDKALMSLTAERQTLPFP
jgi:DNA-binding MarR family transcriptional regulator